ncbi:MAG: hypothetical protein JWO71_550 [Candidatus Acidoferrum typicum]|nr:hypothetical protein [Candidatus Acidoferrum typicum]
MNRTSNLFHSLEATRMYRRCGWIGRTLGCYREPLQVPVHFDSCG